MYYTYMFTYRCIHTLWGSMGLHGAKTTEDGLVHVQLLLRHGGQGLGGPLPEPVDGAALAQDSGYTGLLLRNLS